MGTLLYDCDNHVPSNHIDAIRKNNATMRGSRLRLIAGARKATAQERINELLAERQRVPVVVVDQAAVAAARPVEMVYSDRGAMLTTNSAMAQVLAGKTARRWFQFWK